MARKKMSEDEKKSKLTIRINEVMLNRFDEMVEHNNEKRSSLIEKLLQEYIQKNQNKITN